MKQTKVHNEKETELSVLLEVVLSSSAFPWDRNQEKNKVDFVSLSLNNNRDDCADQRGCRVQVSWCACTNKATKKWRNMFGDLLDLCKQRDHKRALTNPSSEHLTSGHCGFAIRTEFTNRVSWSSCTHKVVHVIIIITTIINHPENNRQKDALCLLLLTSLSVINCPSSCLSPLQRWCNWVKEKVANTEVQWMERCGRMSNRERWTDFSFFRQGQRCGNGLGMSGQGQSVGTDGRSETASSRGKRSILLAAKGDTALCQRLTQQGSRCQEAMWPASGTNLIQRLRTDRHKTSYASYVSCSGNMVALLSRSVGMLAWGSEIKELFVC